MARPAQPGSLPFARTGQARIFAGGPDLLAFDLDGTVLAPGSGALVPGALDALRSATEMGVSLVACSGRPTVRAREVTRVISPDGCYEITFGGAETRDPGGDEAAARAPMDEATCAAVRAVAQASGLQTQTFDSPAGVLRIVLSGDPSAVGTAARAIAARCGRSVGFLQPDPGVLAVQAGGATKLSALRVLTARLGLHRERVAYLGDSADDVPALRWAGLGVAVSGETGCDEALAAADLSVGLEQAPELILRLAQARGLRFP